jgi:hypothetical protein
MDKKDRVIALVDYYANGNKSQFAKMLGITPQTINTWIARNTFDAELLYAKCETLSADWLLAGKGDMIRNVPPNINQNGVGVPYFDVDFCGGFDMMLNDQTAVPTGYINFPQYNRADSWANISGHSMEPLISHGDIIALRKIEDWQTFILYGEIYGIMTEEYRTVKRIRKSDNPDNLLLEPINKGYDSTEIPKAVITGVWQVLGCAKRLF